MKRKGTKETYRILFKKFSTDQLQLKIFNAAHKRKCLILLYINYTDVQED